MYSEASTKQMTPTSDTHTHTHRDTDAVYHMLLSVSVKHTEFEKVKGLHIVLCFFSRPLSQFV